MNETLSTQNDRCASCGNVRSEHSINGACYGVCGEFVEVENPFFKHDLENVEGAWKARWKTRAEVIEEDRAAIKRLTTYRCHYCATLDVECHHGGHIECDAFTMPDEATRVAVDPRCAYCLKRDIECDGGSRSCEIAEARNHELATAVCVALLRDAYVIAATEAMAIAMSWCVRTRPVNVFTALECVAGHGDVFVDDDAQRDEIHDDKSKPTPHVFVGRMSGRQWRV
jgi:hypothetical protein